MHTAKEPTPHPQRRVCADESRSALADQEDERGGGEDRRFGGRSRVS